MRGYFAGSVFIAIAVLVSGLSGSAMCQDEAASQIKEAVLFTNEALVTRQAHVKVAKGMQDIRISVSAYSVDKDSVSASVYGEGEVLAVQLKEVATAATPQDSLAVAEKNLKDAKAAKQILLDEKEVLGKKYSLLDSLIEFAKVQIPQEMKTSFPKPEDLDKTLVFLDNNYSLIAKKRQEVDYKIEEADRDIDAAQRELDALRASGDRSKKYIGITFNSAKEQDVKIVASYLASPAAWSPIYKAEVPPDLKKLTLTMFASMTQKTGEDWKDAKLSVSNVIPLKGAEIPQVWSWLLDIPRPVRTAMRAMAQSPVMFDMAVKKEKRADDFEYEGAAELAEPAAFVQAEATELPLSFEYSFPSPVTFDSRDNTATMPLFSKDLSGKPYYIAAPKVSQLTFLIYKAAADKELLAAPLNVYFSGRYTGRTDLGAKRPGEEFEVNLGADRAVIVKREKVLDKKDETFFGKVERDTIVRNVTYKITAENLKDMPVSLKIIDAIPVSKTDKIAVKDIKLSQEPVTRSYLDREGVCLWELQLAKGEKREITIDFTLTYPKNAPIDVW